MYKIYNPGYKNDSSLCLDFSAWLSTQGYSRSTISNYLADLRKYLSSTDTSNFLSPDTLQQYSLLLSAHNQSRRLLASFKVFCQFAADQKLIPFNPLLHKETQKDIKALLHHFKQYLLSQNSSPSTIKNYLNDIRQFINYFDSET